MKGFFIEITNNLLESKHRKAMKESVWLFMWLLDKITSIDEDGLGKVLGGMPVTYKMVNEELDMPERTYTDWVERLRSKGYIRTLRTPRGLVFEVFKAQKVFGRKADTLKTATHSDTQKKTSDTQKKHGDTQISRKQIKTIQDNTKTTLSSFKKSNGTYRGLEMRKAHGKLWVITPDGEWKEFAGKKEDIVYAP